MNFSYRTRSTVLFFIASLLLGLASTAWAQEQAAFPQVELDLSSPRATVTTFLSAMNNVRGGDTQSMEKAVACLNLEGVLGPELDTTGPERARQLFDVLDNQTVFLDDLPETTNNRALDIPLPLGENVKLELRLSNSNEWRFSSQTVKNLPEYHALVLAKRAEAAADVDVEKKVDPRLASPRATMRTYLEGMSRWDDGGIEEVLVTLDLSEIPEAVRRERGEIAAELMKDILDRFALVVYQTIPDATLIGEEETYTYPLEDGLQLTMHKVRSDNPLERVWKFSPSTIAKLQEMADSVREREFVVDSGDRVPRSKSLRVRNWVADRFPALLGSILSVEYWQWIGLFAIIFAGMAISRLFVYVLTFVLGRVFRRENLAVNKESEKQVISFARPVRLMFMAWVWTIGLTFLNISPAVQGVLKSAAITITYGGAIWAGWMLIELIGTFLRARAETTTSRFDDLLVPLIVRSLKIFVVVAGIVAIVRAISPERYTELLAGIGIGGLALALAAKDAIANLFGSVMIIAERPFEIGDWIQVGDVDGSVESVGMRSTRVRTFYNSLVTIPNSELTNVAIDNYGKRKYRRIKTTLGVTYDTTPEQIEAFCEGIRQLIREHPYTRKDYFHVYFNDYGPYSLDILVYCFVQTPDWGTELRERHRLFSDILRLAQRLGVEFAFPTQVNIDPTEPGQGGTRVPVPKNTFDAVRMARKHAATIVEETLGRGMKPPPVDYEAQYPDVDDLIDAHQGGSTEDDQDGEGDGDGG